MNHVQKIHNSRSSQITLELESKAMSIMPKTEK
ncbi:hypothetical protein T4C_13434 [Trichinella pseudospiralis]|uniref:Uncharacterized protein n=1 Tax=Trichinella pseudospiralis TaxID=6337 RepID=A0A0V1J3B8_TRIPS|nr:hypothetical protein T4C_13434 [Trichinella pseudospiralis]